MGFDDQSSSSGSDGSEEARGLVVFDYDDDGDLDLLVANFRSTPYLYENRSITTSWIKVSLEGTVSARDAYGAVVTIRTNGKVYHQSHNGVDFLGQSRQPLHFGLGFAEVVEQLSVT